MAHGTPDPPDPANEVDYDDEARLDRLEEDIATEWDEPA